MKKRLMVFAVMLVMVLSATMVVLAGSDDYLVSEEPLILTLHYHFLDGVFTFDDDYPVFKKAAELTNVTLKGTVPSSVSDSKQAFNLMITSGDMADIVHYSNPNKLNEYGMEGAFIPLNDLINEHAPHIKEFFDNNPNVKRGLTAADGNIYRIPFLYDGDVAHGWFIRIDWLEKLDLEIPNTVEEYHDVLKAFREQDPNENGKKDEIPFFSRGKIGAIYDLMFFWNARRSWYEEDGKVHYGPYENGFKEGAINVAKWYEEGLIDPEVFTRRARAYALGNNLGGSTHDWFGSTAGFNPKLKEKIDGFKFEPMAPPAAIDGVRREVSKREALSPYGWSISHTNKYPVKTIKYFDFWWTKQGRRLFNFGIESETYDMVNGEPIFQQWLFEQDRGILEILYDMGVQSHVGARQDFRYEKQWMNPVALKGVKMYMDNNYPIKQFPNLNYTKDELEIVNKLSTRINTYVEEMLQKWILGDKDVEATWDDYVNTLQEMGIDKLTAVQQQAYDRIK